MLHLGDLVVSDVPWVDENNSLAPGIFRKARRRRGRLGGSEDFRPIADRAEFRLTEATSKPILRRLRICATIRILGSRAGLDQWHERPPTRRRSRWPTTSNDRAGVAESGSATSLWTVKATLQPLLPTADNGTEPVGCLRRTAAIAPIADPSSLDLAHSLRLKKKQMEMFRPHLTKIKSQLLSESRPEFAYLGRQEGGEQFRKNGLKVRLHSSLSRNFNSSIVAK